VVYEHIQISFITLQKFKRLSSPALVIDNTLYILIKLAFKTNAQLIERNKTIRANHQKGACTKGTKI
jgi:hypothetical protein